MNLFLTVPVPATPVACSMCRLYDGKCNADIIKISDKPQGCQVEVMIINE